MKPLYEIYHDKRGMTRRSLARVSGLPVETIRNFDKNIVNINKASVYTLCRLAVALDTPLSEFYGGNCAVVKKELLDIALFIDEAIKKDLIK